MEGACGAAVLGLLVIMLAASADCMPHQRRPFPRGHHSTTSNPPPPPVRAMTHPQRPARYGEEMASDELFGAALGIGQFLLDLLLNRASNGAGGFQTPYTGAAQSPHQTARGQLAVIEQGRNQQDELLLDTLVDELWREYTQQQNPTSSPTTTATKQVSSYNIIVKVSVANLRILAGSKCMHIQGKRVHTYMCILTVFV